MAPPDFAFHVRLGKRRLTNIAVAGVVATLYIGGYAMIGGPLVGIAAGVGTALVAAGAWGLAWLRVAREVPVAALNASFNLIALGKLRDASAVLDELEPNARFAWVQRLCDIQRAIIALRKGEMEQAARRLDAAITRPIGRLQKDNSLQQIEGAHALRAFVRAALGRREGALEDIAVVRASEIASDDALARVALAEAMIYERSGRRDDLKALLDRDRELLLEHTHPRERAIVRAYQRMLKAATGSVYRQTAPRDADQEERDEPMLSDWVAKVAPGAAPFVRSPRGADQEATAPAAAALATPAATERGRRAVEAAREQARPKGMRTALVAIGGALGAIALFGALAAVVFVAGSAPAPVEASAPSAPVSLLWLAPLAAFAGGIVLAVRAARRRLRHPGRAARRRERPRGAAQAAARTRRREPSEQELRALGEGPSNVVAAQAYLMLAAAAERRGDMPAALDLASRGLGRLTDAQSRAAADVLYPDLVSLRAFALAACDRNEEANAELALLGASYPHHARAVFRVRLVQWVRFGDLTTGARWVEQSEADLPLSVREELLADVTRAAAAPEQAGAGEIARLRDELRGAPELRAWLGRVGPRALEVFERGGDADLPAPGGRYRVAAAAERDAEAEIEADQALAAQQRAGHLRRT